MAKMENVGDYPRPPALEPVAERLMVLFDGTIIANTTSGFRVLETFHPPTYYIPQADLQMDWFKPIARTSICEWKGRAAYFDIVGPNRRAPAAAWCYPKPTSAFIPITNYLAIYAEPMDECRVGEMVVLPQPGNFYGGWLTENITGPVKGVPGTNHW
ncbi:MAG: DUF427 domain-containing protein [Pseudomonadota bacterium]